MRQLRYLFISENLLRSFFGEDAPELPEKFILLGEDALAVVSQKLYVSQEELRLFRDERTNRWKNIDAQFGKHVNAGGYIPLCGGKMISSNDDLSPRDEIDFGILSKWLGVNFRELMIWWWYGRTDQKCNLEVA